MKITRDHKVLTTISIVSMLISAQLSTQYFAYSFLYNAQLGNYLFKYNGASIYYPFKIFHWVKMYKNYYPDICTNAGLIFFPAIVITLMCVIIAIKISKKNQDEFGKKSWGNRQDAIDSKILHPNQKKPAGVVLGKWNKSEKLKNTDQPNFQDENERDLLFYDGPEHQLVVGASRAGKGVGHVIPTLLTYGESVFVYDPKEECYDITGKFRSEFSHSFYLNFANENSACFNFLMEVPKSQSEISYAQIIAAGLIDASSAKSSTGWDFFDKSTFILLTAIILHVLYTAVDDEKTLEKVRSSLFYLDYTLLEMEGTHHRNKLKKRGKGELERDQDGNFIPETHPEIVKVAKLFLKMSSKQRDAIQGTAITMLAVFSDPIVCDITSRSDFMLGDLMCADAPVSLYLQVAPTDQLRLRPLTRLVINQLCAALLKNQFEDTRGRKKKHKLLTQLDEFPSLGNLSSYVTMLKQMAGYGMKAHLFVQSFKDLADAYGRDSTIQDNMHITVAFAGADPDSNAQISRMVGKANEERSGTSQGANFMAGVSINTSEQTRDILDAGKVRELSYDEQLVFVTGSKPFRTPKLRYYEDSLFLSRATDIRKGDKGPDQSKGPDVPFRAGKNGHGDWIGTRAIYLHVPTQEQLKNLENKDRQGGGTGKKEANEEITAPTEAEKKSLAPENANFEASITVMAKSQVATYEAPEDEEYL